VGILTVFPYYNNFKTVTNHIRLEKELSKDFEEAKQQVLNALKCGHNIIVNRIWSKNMAEPHFSVVTDGEEAFPGGTAKLNSASRLVITLPAKGLIRLIHNGDPVHEEKAAGIEYARLKPGKYRFETYFRGKPWMFSNPILCE
jgi:hypothetical protein